MDNTPNDNINNNNNIIDNINNNNINNINNNINNNFVCVLDYNDTSLFDLGIQSLKNNNFAVVILAGGQGSRLGSDLPKALFKLNGKSLIDYHIERIIKIQEDYECSITLFIMVSSFTEKEIKKLLQNNNFNLKIKIIKQEDRECKKIDDKTDKGYYEVNDNKGNDNHDQSDKGNDNINDNHSDDKSNDNINDNINQDINNNFILYAPGGNVDVFKSLSNVNLDSFLGINIISVDNVLAKVLDPNFVGGFIKNNLEILSKAVKKRENENVGVFEIKSEGLRIKEYNQHEDKGLGDVSKLGKGLDKDTHIINNNNHHFYGNICNHLFSPSFIKKMTKIPLKEHSVLKKIPFLRNGQWVKPIEPNGYKTETFIFDCFEYATRNGFMKVKREEEFAPLKNGNESKEDNPRTCEEILSQIKQ